MKPACVKLSQVALCDLGSSGNHQPLRQALTHLRLTLQTVLSAHQLRLDDKLTDYIFFPISHVLRQSSAINLAEQELVVQCLHLLIQHGWAELASPALAPQLLIFLTFLVDRATATTSISTPRKELSDGLQEHVFLTIRCLLERIVASPQACQTLLTADNVPAVGHTVSVLLDAAKTGPTVRIQIEALDALRFFCASIADRDVVKSFLPGLVSVLTVILTPSTQRRRTAKSLIASLRLLETVFKRVFADASHTTTKEGMDNATLSAANVDPWLTATAAQIKMALANIFKLRQHGRNDVRAALDNLCRTILEDCNVSLQVCLPLVLESAIILQTTTPSTDNTSYLAVAMNLNATIAELAQSTIYNWLLSTPQHMLLNDEARKRQSLQQLTHGLGLIISSGAEWPFLVDTISTTLQEALFNVIHSESKPAVIEISGGAASADTVLVNLGDSHSSATTMFPPVLSQRKHQMEVVRLIEEMVRLLARWSGASYMAKVYLEAARGTGADSRLVAYWLALNLIKDSSARQGDDDELVTAEEAGTEFAELREDMYTYALELVTSSADDDGESDWRLNALALEAIAFHASQAGDTFRTELVDVLYPIVHLAGSRNPYLREHAVTCLNVLAKSCGYTDAKDLLVSNVDYLVNAVSIKINSFDIAPQAPQVLMMMVKLCGPTLLPFLDDLVDGIFHAIECFHEYTKLTTLLFNVLGAIIDEGVKVSPLKQSDATRPSHYKKPIQPANIASVLAMIEAKTSKVRHGSSSDDIENMMNPNQEQPSAPNSTPPAPKSAPKPHPTTRTYALLHRIAHQTQHHLPSASPALRTALLNVLRTALPHLAAYDDAYLPLVHTLWPVLVLSLIHI